HRVRVTSTPTGRIEVTATPLPMKRFNDTPATALDAATQRLEAGGTLPRAALALQRVDESDPARSHKTTSRDLYYAGRRYAEAAGLEDVLFLDSNGTVSEGSIATVFVVHGSIADGDVATPPLSSGALPGVLREELLDMGLVREQPIAERELRQAGAVLIGSSVRGLRRVALLDELVDVA
ncbi:MAG TPA: aminotransferase class IV, partial [Trueperaceae bacterium]|nr:aminotransferase class IV [Trueperaceae bacterium]